MARERQSFQAWTPCADCFAGRLSICSLMDDVELEAFRGLGREMVFGPREFLARRGQEITDLFIVTRGVARLFHLLADGRRQICGLLSSGSIIGLPRATKNFCCSIQAISQVSVCAFHHSDVLPFLEQHSELTIRVLIQATDEFQALHEHIVLLGRKRADERLSWFLLTMSHKQHHRHPQAGDALDLKITRVDIADYLGLTPETVSRTMSDFRAAGMIDIDKGGTVILTSPVKLASVAGIDHFPIHNATLGL